MLFLSPSVNCLCDVPSVTTKLQDSVQNATAIYSNRLFPLGATFQDECNTPSDYELQWEVCAFEEDTGVCNQVIKYGKSWTPPRPKLLFPRLFRGAKYLYIRCVFRSSTEEHKVKAYDNGYVRIVLPPLVAKIIGPDRVIRGNHTVVILDASESYDPDKKYIKTKGMSLKWSCRMEREALDNQPDSSSQTVVEEHTGSCYEFTGKVNNTLPVLHVNLQNVKGNKTYVIEVVVQKGDRTMRASHNLRVDEPFVFSIGYVGRKITFILTVYSLKSAN